MQRVKIVIQYDGTGLCGWQVQKGKVSVQGLLEDAIHNVFHERVSVVGSGRTDAGVHAWAQVAHFDIKNIGIKPEKIRMALNAHLPEQVRVQKAEFVEQDFHARFSAKSKTYRYYFYNSDIEWPLFLNRALFVHDRLNFCSMEESFSHIVGKHNFACFCGRKSGKINFERTIVDAKLQKMNEEGLYYFEFSADGFLKQMVRNVVGTVLDIGRGKFKPCDINRMIAGQKRSGAGKTAPAHGLYLVEVRY